MRPGVQRVVGVLVLLTVGMLSLPFTAYVLGDQGSENWVLPLQLLVMAAVGTGITLALPALATAGASTTRRALTGVTWGLVAALIGALVFWLLLSGIRGA